jgi:hypothetical protein
MDDETQKLELCSGQGTARKRTSSRLRRTNDRNVSSIHEDHEDDENAEIGVVQRSGDCSQTYKFKAEEDE